MTWRENAKLYEVAKKVCHDFGMPWTDPRSGKTYPPPKRRHKVRVQLTIEKRDLANRETKWTVLRQYMVECHVTPKRVKVRGDWYDKKTGRRLRRPGWASFYRYKIDPATITEG